MAFLLPVSVHPTLRLITLGVKASLSGFQVGAVDVHGGGGHALWRRQGRRQRVHLIHDRDSSQTTGTVHPI
ncbi:MAG: hypothetical protein FD149_2275 [Rhodospirillaceae bacterium]|nr:MAG: hypothetical protein FD149_2275 [Rhodospirillaceae bacterium]